MRLPPDLPPDLTANLDALAHGISRTALAERAAAQSRHYRAGGGSQPVASRDDALAYAFTRLPATYAAVMATFDAARNACPGMAPRTMLDVGAGPGTATFAAVRAFDSITDIHLLDTNAHLRDLAIALMRNADSAALKQADYRQGDARALLATAAPADLVVASYMAGELVERDLPGFVAALWNATRETLAVIEPGTPAGYGRIMRIRAELIAVDARVAAPCPHERPCPLAAPDWCHFAQRLPRSRDHLRVKGGEVPFEDEKFSYLVLSRSEPRRAAARVLAPPHLAKVAATTKLCTADAVIIDTVARRQAKSYRERKSWRWGDAVTR